MCTANLAQDCLSPLTKPVCVLNSTIATFRLSGSNRCLLPTFRQPRLRLQDGCCRREQDNSRTQIRRSVAADSPSSGTHLSSISEITSRPPNQFQRARPKNRNKAPGKQLPGLNARFSATKYKHEPIQPSLFFSAPSLRPLRLCGEFSPLKARECQELRTAPATYARGWSRRSTPGSRCWRPNPRKPSGPCRKKVAYANCLPARPRPHYPLQVVSPAQTQDPGLHRACGDHYRTRLTHTLEMSQIARTIARALRMNEDITEAIALAHDLGHTPFGHAGEDTLRQDLRPQLQA